MQIIVLKFGGTSVGTIDRIKKVSNIIATYVKKKYKVIVVSSAMSGVTNDLVNKSKKYRKTLIHQSMMFFYLLANKLLVHL